LKWLEIVALATCNVHNIA